MKKRYANKSLLIVLGLLLSLFSTAQEKKPDFSLPAYEKAIDQLAEELAGKMTRQEIVSYLSKSSYSSAKTPASTNADPTFGVNPLIDFVEFLGNDDAVFTTEATLPAGYTFVSIAVVVTYENSGEDWADDFDIEPNPPVVPPYNATITFDVKQNFSTEARYATIEVTPTINDADDNNANVPSAEVYILQGPAPGNTFIIVSPEIQAFDFQEQNSEKFNVIHFNIPGWQVDQTTLPDVNSEGGEWITIDDEGHTGTDDYVIFNILENDGQTARSHNVTIKATDGSDSDQLTIHQGAEAVSTIIVSPKIQAFDFEEQKSEKFNIIHFNIPGWQVDQNTLPDVNDEEGEWITIDQEGHTGTDDYVIFNILENNGQAARSHTIKIEATDGSDSDLLTIHQGAEAVSTIIVSPKIQAFDFEEQKSEKFNVIHFNIPGWQVDQNSLPDVNSEGGEWITIDDERHTGTDDYVIFNILENDGQTARSHNVTIKATDGSTSDQLTIHQGAELYSTIIVSPEIQAFDFKEQKSEKFNVIHFNIPGWQVDQNTLPDVNSEGGEWITIDDENTIDDYVIFNILENNEQAARSHTIKIEATDGSDSDLLTIHQGAEAVSTIIVSPEIQAFDFNEQKSEKFNVIHFNIPGWQVDQTTLPDVNDEGGEWITIDDEGHTGTDDYVIFNILENNGQAARSHTIKIEATDGSDSDLLTIHQGAEVYSTIIASPEVQAYTYEEVTETEPFDIIHYNVDGWTAVIASEDQGWVSVENSLNDEGPLNWITFNLTKHTGEEYRDATIIIENGDGTVYDEITIYQGALSEPIILASPEVQAYTYEEVTETEPFDIIHYNVDGWTAVIASEDQGWVSVENSLNDEGPLNWITFNLTKNTGEEYRDATILFQNSDGSVFDEITIYQGALSEPIILASPEVQAYTYEEFTETEPFDIIHYNVDGWTAVIASEDQGWVSVENSLNDEGPLNWITFNLTKHTGEEYRDATIIIENGDGTVYDEITIYQGALSEPIILASPEVQAYTYEEVTETEPFDIIHYNVDGWTAVIASEDQGWVSVENSLNDEGPLNWITFNLTKHTGEEYRDATIIIENGDGTVYDEITIYQGALSDSLILASPEVQAYTYEEVTETEPFDIIHYNVDGWTAVIASEDQGWVSVENSLNNEGPLNWITFNLTKHTGEDYRDATIRFQNGDGTIFDTITIYQGALSEPIILASPEVQAYTYEEVTETEPFDIIHYNVDGWTAVIASEDQGWVAVENSLNDEGPLNWITFNLTKHTGEDYRDATVLIQNGDGTVFSEITIYQGALSEPIILASPEVQAYTYEEVTETEPFDIIHYNVDGWTAIIASEDQGWVSVENSLNDEGPLNWITFNLTKHTGEEYRDATIIIENGDGTVFDEITIYQGALSVSSILVTPEIFTIDYTGTNGVETLPFEIIHFNISDWLTDEIYPPGDEGGWIDAVNIYKPAEPFDYITLLIDPNPKDEYRKAEIVIYEDGDDEIDDTLTIYQGALAESVILVSPKVDTVGHEGGITDEFFVINFNVDGWRIAPLPPGIGEPIYGESNGTEWVKFPVESNPNTDYTPHSYTITIEEDIDEPLVSAQLTIWQDAIPNPYLLASPRIKTVGFDGGPLMFDVESGNLDEDGWDYGITIYDPPVPIEDEWIIDKENIDSLKMTFTAEPNPDKITRSARVSITANNNEVTDTVIVFQYSDTSSYILTAPQEQSVPWDYTGNLFSPFLVTKVNVEDVRFEVDSISEDPWLSPLEGIVGDDPLIFTVTDTNQLAETRIARIRIYDAGSTDVEDIIYVYQYSSSDPYIILVPAANDTTGYQGGSFMVKAYSNLPEYVASYNAYIDDSIWYTLSEDTLHGIDSTEINILHNYSAFKPRSAVITFAYDTVSTSFYLKQGKAPYEPYELSGVVTNSETGKPFPNITIFADTTVTTDINGHYVAARPKKWQGSIVPFDSSYSYYFNPPQYNFNLPGGLIEDTSGLDFTAYLIDPKVKLKLNTVYICEGEVLDTSSMNYPTPEITGTYGPESYLWRTKGDEPVTISTELVAEFAPSEHTTYVFELSNNGTIVSDEFTLIVKDRPDPRGIIGDTSVCMNQAGVVYYVDTLESSEYFRWELPDGGDIVSYVTTNILVVDWGSKSDTTYPLGLITMRDGCSAPDTIIQNIHIGDSSAPEPPVVGLKDNDDEFLYCDNEDADIYRWGWLSVKDSEVMGETILISGTDQWYFRIPTEHKDKSDLYRYFVEIGYDSLECYSRSYYDPRVGIDVAESDPFNIFPNPTDGIINIRLNQPTQNSHVPIKAYDFSGSLVFNKESPVYTGGLIQIDESRYWNPGIYLIHIKLDDKTYHKKVIVR